MCVCVCMCAQSLSCVWPFATPRIVARQTPLSMAFPRQECLSGLLFPPPGDLQTLGSNQHLWCFLHRHADCSPLRHLKSPQVYRYPVFSKSVYAFGFRPDGRSWQATFFLLSGVLSLLVYSFHSFCYFSQVFFLFCIVFHFPVSQWLVFPEICQWVRSLSQIMEVRVTVK